MLADFFDPARAQANLRAFGEKACELLRKSILTKKATRRFGSVNASGNLAKSVRYEIGEGGDELRIYAAGYAFAVELGRGPGRYPNIKAIRAWIDDKGIQPTGISKDSLAFLIARKIAREGTDIYSEGQRSGVLTDIINARTIESLRTDLALTVAQSVSSFLLAA